MTKNATSFLKRDVENGEGEQIITIFAAHGSFPASTQGKLDFFPLTLPHIKNYAFNHGSFIIFTWSNSISEMIKLNIEGRSLNG